MTLEGYSEYKPTWRERVRWKLFPAPVGRPLITNDPRTFITVELRTTLNWKDRIRALISGRMRTTACVYTDVEVKDATTKSHVWIE